MTILGNGRPDGVDRDEALCWLVLAFMASRGLDVDEGLVAVS